MMKKTIQWISICLVGTFVFLIMLGIGGVKLPFSFPHTEISNKSPYSDYVGREFRVIAPVNALLWNDYPDKQKILTITLVSPPGTKNRFVSDRIALKLGQKIIIKSAWQYFALVEYVKYYSVSVPGLDVPADIPIKIDMRPNEVPDPRLFELVK